jgi:5-methyltetrahydrofolate--homocysteine methyltransferase
MSDYLKAVQERVVIFDGAMGTCVQSYNLPLDDFWGKDGYNDILVLSRPDVVKEIHAAYFNVGADVVETNTFSSTRIVMAEYDMQDQVHEVNLAAAKLAREVASSFSSNRRKRFVAGSMGPTTKLPSLGHIGFDAMAAAYTEQAVALIEGGVDVLLLETCQDILQAKAGLVGIFDALKKTGKNVPVQVQVTLEATGTMLLGTEIGAALTTLEMFDVAVIGMNCATGPKGDERRRALSGREFAAACLRAAQCRAAAECRRTRGLRCNRRSWPTITSSSSPNTACASWAAAAAPRTNISRPSCDLRQS